MKVQLQTVRCKRCAYAWVPTKSPVLRCARCKSEYFATPRRDRRGMRPEPKGKK